MRNYGKLKFFFLMVIVFYSILTVVSLYSYILYESKAVLTVLVIEVITVTLGIVAYIWVRNKEKRL